MAFVLTGSPAVLLDIDCRGLGRSRETSKKASAVEVRDDAGSIRVISGMHAGAIHDSDQGWTGCLPRALLA